MIKIRQATTADYDEIWEIIHQVLQSGDTYVFAPSSSKEKMLGIWCAPNKHTYVALYSGKIAGTYAIGDNQMDLGSHIANGSYMVSPAYAGKGIGKAMGEHSLTEARMLGYHAMQFNIVIKSNHRAVKLWQSIGFNIIGEIPDAFNHQQNGLTNAYIMYQKL
jgi:ribosomal protein S18 acetylase RimI-like enzyme